jgi:ABC-type sugar transport system ATPase subunit
MGHPEAVTVSRRAPVLLRTSGLRKSYGAVHAVRGMDFDLRAGEVHGLIGENGAGKSTLLGMIAGRITPDEGSIVIDGQEHPGLTPRQARDAGIAIVYQELSLCPNLTVAENVFLGDVPVRRGARLDRRRMRSRTREILAQLGTDVDPDTPIAELRPAEQQLTEIARALARRARIVVLDEPTSSLTHEDFETLRAVIDRLKEQGVGVIFVSHRLAEVLDLCDRVTVMRDGQQVRTMPVGQASVRVLARLMVGDADIRPRDERPARAEEGARPDRLRLQGASAKGAFEGVDLRVRAGEIVGLAGLRGSGRHELTEAIYGLRPFTSGEMELDGVRTIADDPRAARALGIRFVPQERRAQGLVGIWDVQRNLALGNLAWSTQHGIIRASRMRRWATEVMRRFGVVPTVPTTLISSLSGGNQQKVVLARTLVDHPNLLLLLEPTRGIDVAAKAEVAAIVRATAAGGSGVLVVDSEVEELLALCDRVYVMHRGRISGDLEGSEMSEDQVAYLASGGSSQEAA